MSLETAKRIEQLAKERDQHDQALGKSYETRDTKKQEEESRMLNEVCTEMRSLSDLYRRPEMTLTDAEYQLYYTKLRPYHHWHVDSFFIGDEGIIHLAPEESQKVTWEEGMKLLPKTTEEAEQKSQYILIPKATMTESYVYVRTPVKPSDDTDQLFTEKKTQGFDKRELYGLHTYGGYHAFFRPDLKEVIRLLNEIVSIADLEKIDRIYVTTDPHPTDSIYDNFDRVKDMHRGKTTAFIVWNKKSDDNVPLKSQDNKAIKRKRKTTESLEPTQEKKAKL